MHEGPGIAASGKPIVMDDVEGEPIVIIKLV